MQFLSKNLGKIKGKSVLLRLDLNEPVDEKGKLLDDFRLRSVLPTLQALQKAKCKVVIVAHRGRPEGSRDKKLSLAPIAQRLAELLRVKLIESSQKIPDYPIPHVVFYIADITDKKNQDSIRQSANSNIILLENIRYYEGEESNSAKFASDLAELADVYVNDGFAVSHRKSASVVAITAKLPSYAGLLLEQEIKHLQHLLSVKVRKPFVLVMGGIKISDKSKTLVNLGKRADKILVGGGLANAFLAAQGLEIGKSVVEKSSAAIAKQVLLNFKHKIVLPKDVVVKSASAQGRAQVKLAYQINKTDSVFDIGPETILEFSKILKSAKTVCWNGPLGYFEQKPFQTGTFALARIIGGVGSRKALAVAGGGETVAAIRETKQFEHFDHVSTGGGAMLEYLAGKKLPGIEALK